MTTKSEISAALADHNIGFALAKGDQIYGHLSLKTGALIQGLIDGNVECAEGSVIITESGCVKGSITAQRVLIEGQVRSNANEAPSKVIGLEMISVSSGASVEADLVSKAFAIHSTGIKGSLHTLS